jgi:hypothetical protein
MGTSMAMVTEKIERREKDLSSPNAIRVFWSGLSLRANRRKKAAKAGHDYMASYRDNEANRDKATNSSPQDSGSPRRRRIELPKREFAMGNSVAE